jgi:uncharacterized protein YuzE
VIDEGVGRDLLPDPPSIRAKDDLMEAIKILEHPANLTWDCDDEADVLYISVGQPRPAVGVDIGEGVIVRYDEARQELVGLTVLGMRDRLLRGIGSTKDDAPSR